MKIIFDHSIRILFDERADSGRITNFLDEILLHKIIIIIIIIRNNHCII